MVSNKILRKSEGKISLTELGVDFFKKLDEEDIFVIEKVALKEAKKYLSEASVSRLFEGV